MIPVKGAKHRGADRTLLERSQAHGCAAGLNKRYFLGVGPATFKYERTVPVAFRTDAGNRDRLPFEIFRARNAGRAHQRKQRRAIKNRERFQRKTVGDGGAGGTDRRREIDFPRS
jgi:hypothetical protein